MASNNVDEDEFDANWVCCLMEDIPGNCGDTLSLDSDIPWPSLLGAIPCSVAPCASTPDCTDESCKKRVRCGSTTGPSSKACREKMRRDRVNERFLELSAALDPEMTPKCDKTAILADATRMVKILREEGNMLREHNAKLKERINELKSEKNKLRAEKHMLKADKEDMERRTKAFGVHNSGFHFHPSSMPATYAMPYQAVGSKLVPFRNSPRGVSLWQFVPQTTVDTSQDHVLHPPVA